MSSWIDFIVAPCRWGILSLQKLIITVLVSALQSYKVTLPKVAYKTHGWLYSASLKLWNILTNVLFFLFYALLTSSLFFYNTLRTLEQFCIGIAWCTWCTLNIDMILRALSRPHECFKLLSFKKITSLWWLEQKIIQNESKQEDQLVI